MGPSPPTEPDPQRRATLWNGNGEPTALTTVAESSEATFINDRGEVIFEVDGGPEDGTWLWRDGSKQNLTGLGITKVHDLNNKGHLLASTASGFMLFDLDAGSAIVSGTTPSELSLAGLDDFDRILLTAKSIGPGPTVTELFTWMEPGQTNPVSSLVVYDERLRLCDGGVVAFRQPGMNGVHPAAMLDLNKTTAGIATLPRTELLGASEVNDPFDARTGVVVGSTSQLPYSLQTHASGPYIYRVASNDYEYPMGDGHRYIRADRINGAGTVLVWGTYAVKTPRVATRSFLIKERRHRLEITEVAEVLMILFGVTAGQGGIAVKPGGGIVPIGPQWDQLRPQTRDMLRGLTTSELARRIDDPKLRRDVASASAEGLMRLARELMKDVEPE